MPKKSLSKSIELVMQRGNIAVVSSWMIAEKFERKHNTIIKLIENHRERLETYGAVRFESEVGSTDLEGTFIDYGTTLGDRTMFELIGMVVVLWISMLAILFVILIACMMIEGTITELRDRWRAWRRSSLPAVD